MTKKELLREIHKDNRKINRNLQRIINIGLMGIFADTGYEAKQTDNKAGKRLAKTGLLLIGLVEILLFIEDIRDERKSALEEL